MKVQIQELLEERAKPGAVTEKTLSNIAAGLAQRIDQLESALRDGDITVKTLDKGIRKQNDAEADEVIQAAKVLLEDNNTPDRLKNDLANLGYVASALKALQASRLPPEGELPKTARMYFCVEVIIAWKLIKDTDDIPGRERGGTGEFQDFITALLAVAGGHVAGINADELHKSTLAVAKELERIKTPEPEIIDLGDYPPGIWGK